MEDLIICGGTVVDGTGAPGRLADVRVSGGRITEIGEALAADGEREIDASGALVTPSFIDTHTHFDPTLFWDSYADPIPQHGVTTVLVGNCSLSLAPVRPEHVKVLTETFCYIEDLSTDAFDLSIPWTWSTYDEYLSALEGDGLGVNVATLVGHSALRIFGADMASWERASTEAERAVIVDAFRGCLEAGAFGLSTSLTFDVHPAIGPVPSRLADDEEFEGLFDLLAEHDGLVEFLPGLGAGGIRSNVARMTAIGAPRGVKMTYIGIFHALESPTNAIELLDMTKELQDEGVRIYPQISPRTLDIRANWDGGMGFIKLPNGWQAFALAPREEKAAMINDPAWRAVAREEWDRVAYGFIPHQEPDRIRLIDAVSEEDQRWVGHSLADLVAERGGHPSDVLADWVAENDLSPGIIGVGVSNYDADGVAATLTHPATLISNSDAGAHLGMMCAAGDTTLLLTKFVRDRGDMSVESAVNALTGRQADLLGLTDRGVLAEGMRADLNVFALDELQWAEDGFVDDVPGGGSRLRRPPGGYRLTMIDGVVTCESGQDTGHRPGRVLRSSTRA